MRVGDYILTINNQEVQNMDKDEFNKCLRTSAKSAESRGDPLVLEVTSEDSYEFPTTPDITPPRTPSPTTISTPPKRTNINEPYREMRSPSIQVKFLSLNFILFF